MNLSQMMGAGVKRIQRGVVAEERDNLDGNVRKIKVSPVNLEKALLITQAGTPIFLRDETNPEHTAQLYLADAATIHQKPAGREKGGAQKTVYAAFNWQLIEFY